MARWWGPKLRRTRAYLRARVSTAECERMAGFLEPAQLALFDGMQVADRRHGLDVMAYLERRGVTDHDLLLAGLLHDCGKDGKLRLVHRVAWSLGQRYGEWVWRASERMPTFRTGLATLRGHGERSAALAQGAGCSPRTVELIRNQDLPSDEEGRMLHEADEAN